MNPVRKPLQHLATSFVPALGPHARGILNRDQRTAEFDLKIKTQPGAATLVEINGLPQLCFGIAMYQKRLH